MPLLVTSMPHKPQNIYEAILEWGYEHIDEGVSYQDYEKMLAEGGFELHYARIEQLFMELFERANGPPGVTYLMLRRAPSTRYSLKVEAAFRHLERLELVEARASSRNAMLMAGISLILAAIVGACQIGISIWSL